MVYVATHGLWNWILGQLGTGPPRMRVTNLQSPPKPSRALRARQSPQEPSERSR